MFHFYPTASILAASAMSDLGSEQTLVLVGGNSNFNGQGQNPGEIWTGKLQRLLGNNYKVINFATMGSKSSDLAGVVFRMIEPRHPKILLVLNSYSTMQASFDGADALGVPIPVPFTYVFWDAYYKKLISGDADFESNVRRLQRIEAIEHANEFLEIHIGGLIDSLTYARDLWTYLDYEAFFTVWHPLRPNQRFAARKFVREPDRKFPALKERVAKSGMTYDEIMQNVRGHYQGAATYDETGAIIPIEANWNEFRESHKTLFSDRLKSKVLLCLLWPSPHFANELAAKDKKLLDYVIPKAVDELSQMGYGAIDVGRDFDGEDYETSFHFVASGGDKIAAIVSKQIRDMELRQSNAQE